MLSDKTKALLRDLLTVEIQQQRWGLNHAERDIEYKQRVSKGAKTKAVETRAQNEIVQIENKASELRAYIADLEKALREVTS